MEAPQNDALYSLKAIFVSRKDELCLELQASLTIIPKKTLPFCTDCVRQILAQMQIKRAILDRLSKDVFCDEMTYFFLRRMGSSSNFQFSHPSKYGSNLNGIFFKSRNFLEDFHCP